MRARQRFAVVATIVAAAGLTGACSGMSDADPYAQAREQFTAMADELHTVIMAIEPTEWRVDQGQYGAVRSTAVCSSPARPPARPGRARTSSP